MKSKEQLREGPRRKKCKGIKDRPESEFKVTRKEFKRSDELASILDSAKFAVTL